MKTHCKYKYFYHGVSEFKYKYKLLSMYLK